MKCGERASVDACVCVCKRALYTIAPIYESIGRTKKKKYVRTHARKLNTYLTFTDCSPRRHHSHGKIFQVIERIIIWLRRTILSSKRDRMLTKLDTIAGVRMSQQISVSVSSHDEIRMWMCLLVYANAVSFECMYQIWPTSVRYWRQPLQTNWIGVHVVCVCVCARICTSTHMKARIFTWFSFFVLASTIYI